MNTSVSLAIAIVCCATGASAQTVARAYIDPRGAVHIVESSSVDRKIAPEKGQVGCEEVRVAADGKTVAWQVLYANCCTSYPIPLKLVIYRHGRLLRISPPQMIWDWRFAAAGRQVAVAFGPVHGDASGAALYDTRTGRRVAGWDLKTDRPDWAEGLSIQ